MSNYLSGRKGLVLISASATPTATEIANNIIVPKHDGLHISFETSATYNSGRSIDGVMHITWVKNNMRKLEITMPPSKYDALARVANLCFGKIIYVTFVDPYTNVEITKRMYNSGGKTDVYNGIIQGGLVYNFSFSLIDMGD